MQGRLNEPILPKGGFAETPAARQHIEPSRLRRNNPLALMETRELEGNCLHR